MEFEFAALDFTELSDTSEAPVGAYFEAKIGLNGEDLEAVEATIAKLTFYANFKNTLLLSQTRVPAWECDSQGYGQLEQLFCLAINWEGGHECNVAQCRTVLDLLAESCSKMAEQAEALSAAAAGDHLVMPSLPVSAASDQ